MDFLEKLKEEREKTKIGELGKEEFEKRVKELKKLREVLCDVDPTILSRTNNIITGEPNFPDTYTGERKQGKHIGCSPGFGWKESYASDEKFPKRLIIFFSNGNFVKMPDIWSNEKERVEITAEELVIKVSFLKSESGERIDGYESLKTYIEKFLALWVIIEGTGKRLENPDDDFGNYIATMTPEQILEKKAEIIERLNPRLKKI